MNAVRPGIDVLREDNFARLRGQRVGLMTNPAAVTHDLNSTYRLLTDAPEVSVVALFAPEHGFAASAPDAERIQHQTDARTGLPVYSLYGESYRPDAAMLHGLDVLVCDIQDIGVRFYTFAWTVTHILEAAGEQGVRVMILDRPNPLGGEKVAGPLLEPALASFVGRVPLPIVHGLTLGELARWFNAVWNPAPAELDVIRCAGWQRTMRWPETGLHWVGPSPNMPHLSTLWQYPGACLVEGTTLSEGRGTALPFEVVGAPWIDGLVLADVLNAMAWGGVRFRPHVFQPTASKWAGQTCYGVQAHLTDIDHWRPVETWLGVIQVIHGLYPAPFGWLPPQTDGVEPGTVYHFDRLMGSETYRHGIENGVSWERLTAGWDADSQQFRRDVAAYLLYE
ncbi:MAG: hypothetical protein CL610_25555 [Anaerolineaceae bacterium]|nr:hypothetical protein [Anaerolineaceae bacterium]